MDAAASAATILQLVSFTGEVLVAGYGYLSKVQKAPTEIRSLLKETAYLNASLDQLQMLITENANPHIMSALETLTSLGVFNDCRSLMTVVLQSIKSCDRLHGQGARNFGRRFLWPFKEKDTKQTLQQLGRLREALSAAVTVDSAKALINLEAVAQTIDLNITKALNITMRIADTANSTAEELAQLRSTVLVKESLDQDQSVRSWLLPDGIDTQMGFEAALKLRHHSTGQWLLKSDTFCDWFNGEDGCMWVYGIPGCGKTVLSATVVEYMQTELDPAHSAILYFFCDHRNPKMQKFQDCLHTFTKQLLDRSPDCFNIAKQLYLEKPPNAQGQPEVLSIDESTRLIKQCCLMLEKICVVVDALDECADRGDFFGGLWSLSEQNPKFKLFLTSRLEADLERIISPKSSHTLALAEHMRSDIRLYLTQEIAARLSQGRLKLRQEGLAQDIVAAIEDKADGMILIAKLQLDYICDMKSDRAIKDALHKLPIGINATYDEILQKLCIQYPESIEDIRLVLRWLVGSIVPLTLDQIAEAVSIRRGDDRLERDGIATDSMDLAACCGSLVTVYMQDTDMYIYNDLRGPGTAMLSLSHASVEEYVTSEAIKHGPLKYFSLDLPSIHREIAETCLQYVGFEDFAEPITNSSYRDVDLHQWLRNREKLMERTSQYVLYGYACTYWATHLRLGKATDDENISALLLWFLSPDQYLGRYISWQQMYHQDIQYYSKGRPPLHYAIEFRLDWIIKSLLVQKKDVDELCGGTAALHEAAKCGDIVTCSTLIDRGASLELKSGPSHKAMTALHFAAERGQTAVIKLLLARGASPHARSMSLSNPLFRAVRSGSLETVKILYSAGSDIDAKTWDNWTPLFEAVARGFVQIANQLLVWGADPTIINYMGQSALMIMAVSKGDAHLNQSFSVEGELTANDVSLWASKTEATLREIQKLQGQIRAGKIAETVDIFHEYLSQHPSRLIWRA